MSGRAWAGVVLVVLIVGAGAGYGGYQLGLRANRVGAPTASRSPVPSPSSRTTPTLAISPTPFFPSVTPLHNVVVDGLHCRLPIYLPGQSGSGGFIAFPVGTVTRDASSNVGAPGSQMTPDDPGDWFGLTYDDAVNRWLPVPRSWVRSDGLLYAYATDYNRHAGVNDMYEVNAETGTSTFIYGSPPFSWQVVDVEPDYIYAISLHGQGLYRLTLSGAPSQTYVGDGYWRAASGVYAYGSTIPDGGAIVRMDTRDPSQRVPWFSKSNSADVIGFDGSGNPIIWTGSDLWIASGPDQATRILSKPPLPLPTPSFGSTPVYGAQAPVSDSRGLWLSATDGIYLYTGGQSTKVSNLVAQVAGDCQ